MTPIRSLASACLALLLAGCAAEPNPEKVQPNQEGDRVRIIFSNGYEGELQVVTIKVNGRNVECVVMSGYREGGVSCDYERSTPSPPSTAPPTSGPGI